MPPPLCSPVSVRALSSALLTLSPPPTLSAPTLPENLHSSVSPLCVPFRLPVLANAPARSQNDVPSTFKTSFLPFRGGMLLPAQIAFRLVYFRVEIISFSFDLSLSLSLCLSFSRAHPVLISLLLPMAPSPPRGLRPDELSIRHRLIDPFYRRRAFRGRVGARAR